LPNELLIYNDSGLNKEGGEESLVKRSKSVLKRIRQNEKRRLHNRANVSKYRTAVKKIEAVIEKKDSEAAKSMLPGIVAHIDKAAAKRIISENAAARKKSSLSRRVNALA
jgi:small subunit ribosomal protein S20